MDALVVTLSEHPILRLQPRKPWHQQTIDLCGHPLQVQTHACPPPHRVARRADVAHADLLEALSAVQVHDPVLVAVTATNNVLVVTEDEFIFRTNVHKGIRLKDHIRGVADCHLVKCSPLGPSEIVGVHIVPKDLCEARVVVGSRPRNQLDTRMWWIEDGYGRSWPNKEHEKGIGHVLQEGADEGQEPRGWEAVKADSGKDRVLHGRPVVDHGAEHENIVRLLLAGATTLSSGAIRHEHLVKELVDRSTFENTRWSESVPKNAMALGGQCLPLSGA